MRGDKAYFILTGFDNAITVDDEGDYVEPARYETGTLAFMAYELVANASKLSKSTKATWKPLRHRLRYDWASLFLIALWCICHLTDELSAEDAASLLNHALSMESGETFADCALIKKELCITPIGENPCDPGLPAVAQPLKNWLSKWNQIFQKADDAKVKLRNTARRTAAPGRGKLVKPYDEETAGGWFTLDTLKGLLPAAVPTKQRLNGRVASTVKELEETADVAVVATPANEPARRSAGSKGKGRTQKKQTKKTAAARGSKVVAAPPIAPETETKAKTTRVRQPAADGVSDVLSRLRPRKAINYKV